MKCETAYLQNQTELIRFIELLKEEKVRSYLEIGSKFGGSLWHIGKALPKGSRIVSVDLPHGDESFKVSLPPLQECVGELRKRYGHQVSLIVGDSTDPEVIEEVSKQAPFDACFVDANHTEAYVRKDWATYGPMTRLMAFHDISHTIPVKPPKMPIEVHKVWNEIKIGHRHQEIKLDKNANGIGVLWRN